MTGRRQFVLSAAATSAVAAAPRQAPNIVFIISDDHHFQCLGAAGNPNIQTPNLDRLAARGAFFSNGQISTPQCAPSRGILLTGLETYQSGLLSNGQTGFREGIGPTVVQQLREAAGYGTALIGKWHVKPEPAECGFSVAPLWLRGGASQYRNPVLRRGLTGADMRVEGHITDLFTDAAVDFVRSAPKQKPYLLWLAYNAPHTPWFAPPKYFEPYRRPLPPPLHPSEDAAFFDWQTYYAVISHLDEAVGRLVAAIEESGAWDNTLIVFLGDNGYLCGTKGLSGKVFPWEESIRVPFFASGGVVQPGIRTDAPVASIDLPVTFCDYAGVKPAYKMAGQSLKPLLTGGKANREAAFSVWNDGRMGALAVKYAVEPYRAVRTRTHKYILWESRKDALYDHHADPGETEPRQDPALRAKLRGLLIARMKATADPALAWMQS